jgi:hypothetical protein
MNQERIPLLAYAFIGITSLVLAYATFLDKAPESDSDNQSATSMLPDVFSNSPLPSVAPVPPVIANPIDNLKPINPPIDNKETEYSTDYLEKKQAVGGKTRRNKKTHRKTKYKKH